MKRLIFTSVVVIVMLCSNGWSVELGPTESLKPVLAGLTAVLTDESLRGATHLQERRNIIMAEIKKGFDFREMSRLVVGKTWRKITKEQRDYFTELMTKLMENVYIGKLEGYSDQTVEYVGEKVKGQRAQVTTLIANNDIEVPVHYVMKKKKGKWMVYDINIEGVSLVRNYQQQFKSILRKDKFEGLVKVLEEKTESFQKDSE